MVASISYFLFIILLVTNILTIFPSSNLLSNVQGLDDSEDGDDGSSDEGGDDGSSDEGGDDGSSDEGGDDGSSDEGGDDGSSDEGGDDGSSDEGGDDGSSDEGGDDGSSDEGGDDGSSDEGGDDGSSDEGGDDGSSDEGGDDGSSDEGGDDGSSDEGGSATESLPDDEEEGGTDSANAPTGPLSGIEYTSGPEPLSDSESLSDKNDDSDESKGDETHDESPISGSAAFASETKEGKFGQGNIPPTSQQPHFTHITKLIAEDLKKLPTEEIKTYPWNELGDKDVEMVIKYLSYDPKFLGEILANTPEDGISKIQNSVSLKTFNEIIVNIPDEQAQLILDKFS